MGRVWSESPELEQKNTNTTVRTPIQLLLRRSWDPGENDRIYLECENKAWGFPVV
jgi:hypothetical protein